MIKNSIQTRHPDQQVVYRQLSVPELVEHSLVNGEARLAQGGSLVIDTGKYTGRSPRDRFIVDMPEIHDQIDWGSINQPIAASAFDRLDRAIDSYLADKPVYIINGYAGADPKDRIPVQFVLERASQALFVHQLFIRPDAGALEDFQSVLTVVAAPGFKPDPAEFGLHSEAAVLLHLSAHRILIAGTEYAGEIKKSVFSTLNFHLPAQNVFPMHCSCNVGADGQSALFFGLSGTGKTTLSADASRTLIGDDEHGWSSEGIFNFEGGCYAKAIHLSAKNEPDIWQAIRFGSVSENVTIDPHTREMDFNDERRTENTRVAYPIEFIPHADPRGMAGHPRTVIFLTADAFGVLPPISKLTPEQAQYHFISGYTSKLAGTERDVVAPEAVFSTCFGAPFMPRPASVYAGLLKARLAEHQATVYLINTGWQKGPYGVGQRIPIPETRAMVTAALAGSLATVETWVHPFFQLAVPRTCPGVAPELLNPKAGWSDLKAYDAAAENLVRLFQENFKRFPEVQFLASNGPQLQT